MKQKLLKLLLCLFLGMQVLPLQAKNEDVTLSFGNTIIQVDVSESTGRFAVSTQDGMPSKTTDRNSFLTFFNQVPETAFTTFRINGEDYIFGNDYKEEGGIVSSTVLSGSSAVTVWQVNGVQVTQTLKLVTDFSDPQVGNVRIRYEVANGSGAEVSIGSRIMIDTMLGSNDGSLLLAGREYISNEKELTGNDVPVVWQSMDRKIAADVTSRGVLYGWQDSRKPDSMIIAHYNTLADTKWDCTVDETLNFTSDQNPYGRADSAVALYYEPQVLNAGGNVMYETYYGLGSISDTVGSEDLSIQITAPQKAALNREKTGYDSAYDPFEIVVSVTNNTEEKLENVQVKLGLSENLTALNVDEQYIDLAAKGSYDVSFLVHPSTVEATSVEEAGVQVSHEERLCQGIKYIILPGVSGDIPEVTWSEVAPSVLYTGAVTKKVVIRGTGMDLLQADRRWEMTLTDEVTNKSVSISQSDVTFADDATVSILLPSNEVFAYEAHPHILSLVSDAYGSMHTTIQMSNDRRYESKEYGVMLIGRVKGMDGEWIYDVHVNDTEEVPEDFETLLTIRGSIMEYSLNGHTYYNVANGATINSSILFRNNINPQAVMTVTRYDDGVETLQQQFKDAFSGYTWYGNMHTGLVLNGNGSLYVGDYQFHQGDFYIALDDENRYELRGNDDDSNNEDINDNIGDGEIKEDYQDGQDVEIVTPAGVVGTQLTKTVGALTGMQVSVSNAVIGVDTISLGGSISVSLPWWSSAAEGKDDGEPASPLEEKYSKRDDLNNKVEEGKKTDDLLSLNMEEMRYGVNVNDHTAELVGVKADGGIHLTADSLPKFTSGGAGAEFEINSIDYPGWYIGVGAEVKVGDAFECEMELSLVKEDSGKIYPDSLKFIADGDVVKIPLSVAGFLTRIGGGVSGLYDTIKSNFNIFPPTTLSVYTGYADPTMYTFTVDEVDMSVGGQGISFTAAQGKVIGLKIFEEIGAHLKLYGTKMADGSVYPCVDLGYDSKINILGIIRGESGFWFVADPRLDTIFGNLSLGGKAYVGIYIPDYVPVVGGKEVLAAMAELSTYRVYAGIRVIGIPISVSYYWADRKVKFFDDWEYLEDEFSIPEGDIENALSVTYDTGEGNVSGVMLMGDNMTALPVTTVNSSAWTQHEVDIQDNDYSLIQVQYEDCDNILDHIKVTDPSGKQIKLIENENCIIQHIDQDVSESGKNENWLGISLTAPKNGTWKISYDIDADVKVHKVDETASITAGKPAVKGNTLQVECTMRHLSENSSVDVYLVNQQEISQADTLSEEDLSSLSLKQLDEYYAKLMESDPSGFRITAEPIAVDETTDVIRVALPDTLASGSYAVRTVINDETGNAVSSSLSSDVFTWVNPNTPSKVSQVTMAPCGDEQLRISWSPVENADGYFVTLTDNDHNPVEGVSGMALTDTTVDFGYVTKELIYRQNPDGSYETDENGERVIEGSKTTGVLPNQTYRAVVTAYRTVDGTDYYSDPIVSEAVYLPQSNPAVLSYTLNGKQLQPSMHTESDESINQEVVIEGSYSTQVNSKEVTLGVTADQDISYLIRYDDDYQRDENGVIKEYTLSAGNTAEHILALAEGGSNIEIVALNAAGDYTENIITVTCDTTPPEVMITDSVIYSDQGVYTISGTAQTNTSVVVNGVEVPVENGTFTYHGTGNETVESVSIVAQDRAGNTTPITATVMPSSLKGFKDILIEIDGQIVSSLDQSITLYTGQTVNVSYYGVTEDGTTIQLRNEMVNEEILLGSGVVSMNDHQLRGLSKGEAVLQASYALTDDYVLQNTLMIHVQKPSIVPSVICVSDTVIPSSIPVGTPAVLLSISNAPESLSVEWSISDNPYLSIADHTIVLKERMTEPVTVTLTANGSYTDESGASIPVSLQQDFTFSLRREVVNAAMVDDMTVTIGTQFEQLTLPETVSVTCSDGSIEQVPVTWYKGAYHPMMDGSCTLYGLLETGENMQNPDDIRASVTVIVRKLVPEIHGTDQSVSYDGSFIDVSSLFTGEIIGNPIYEIVGGSGEGSLNGSLLTVTKAGTFELSMTTPESDTHQSQTANAVLTVSKGKKDAPVHPVVVHPTTTTSKDGYISGTDETMEYSIDAGKSWHTTTGTSIEGLRQGTVWIRYRENDLYQASAYQDFTLKGCDLTEQQALVLDVSKTYVYGDYPFGLSITGGSGEGEVHYVSSAPSVIEIRDHQAVIVSAGTAVITAVKDGDDIYNNAAISVSVTVQPKQAKIQITGNKEKTYDSQTAGITAQVVNLLEGDECQVVLTGERGVDAGEYTASIAGLSNRNYTFSDTAFDYVIHPVSVAAAWNTLDSMTYTGFDLTENVQAVYTDINGNTQSAVCKADRPMISAGSYKLTAESGSRNYTVVSNDTMNVTITKANPNIHISIQKKDSLWNDFLKVLHITADDLLKAEITVTGVDERPLSGKIILYKDETQIGEQVLVNGQCTMDMSGAKLDGTVIYASFIPDEACINHHGGQSMKIMTQLDRKITQTPAITAVASDDAIEVLGLQDGEMGNVQIRVNGGTWIQGTNVHGLLPGTQYVIQARYAGNEIYAPSIPSEFTVSTQYILRMTPDGDQCHVSASVPITVKHGDTTESIASDDVWTYQKQKGEQLWISR